MFEKLVLHKLLECGINALREVYSRTRAQSKTGVNSCLLRWHIKKDESESGKIIIWASL